MKNKDHKMGRIVNINVFIAYIKSLKWLNLHAHKFILWKKNPIIIIYKKIIIIHMSDSRIYVTYQQVGSVCIKSTCWQMINDLLTTHIEPFFEKLSIHDYRLSTLRKEEETKMLFSKWGLFNS